MGARIRKLLLLAVCLASAVAIGLFVFLKVDPVSFRAVVFQPAREVHFFFRELDVLTDWNSIKRQTLTEAETINISGGGKYGVEISAGVYHQNSAEGAPVIILLHGAYPWGRRAGLMRMLGSRLAERGWYVIAPDARGFGDSDDPTSIDDPESWRTAADLSRVIDYLEGIEEVDLRTLVVLGHSMGANHALEGGLKDPRVKSLVLIGPGRHTNHEDILVPEWERARLAADRGLRGPIPVAVAKFAYTLGNIRLLSETVLARADHKPVLLIDGDKEGAAKLSFLRDIISELPGPIEYHTLQGIGHYCGVRSFYGSETVYYQPWMFDQFFGILAEFLDRQRSLDATAASDS